MNLYAIIDEDVRVVRHKGKMGIFTDLDMLKKHAWRYVGRGNKYKVAELEMTNIYPVEQSL